MSKTTHGSVVFLVLSGIQLSTALIPRTRYPVCCRIFRTYHRTHGFDYRSTIFYGRTHIRRIESYACSPKRVTIEIDCRRSVNTRGGDIETTLSLYSPTAVSCEKHTQNGQVTLNNWLYTKIYYRCSAIAVFERKPRSLALGFAWMFILGFLFF